MDFNKIEEILLCPICQEISFPPIYQFGNGHVVCSKCIRALVSEQLTETMEVNCKHWENGCQTKFLFKDAKSHLQDCLYEELNVCEQFGSKCKTLVSMADFPHHCLTEHYDLTHISDGEDIKLHLDQSASLANLKKGSATFTPQYRIFGDTVYVIYTKYQVKQELIQWSVVTLKISEKSNNSIKRVEITTRPNLGDGPVEIQNIWVGESMNFTRFNEIGKVAENWEPRVTFALPLGCFIDKRKSGGDIYLKMSTTFAISSPSTS